MPGSTTTHAAGEGPASQYESRDPGLAGRKVECPQQPMEEPGREPLDLAEVTPDT